METITLATKGVPIFVEKIQNLLPFRTLLA